MGLFLPLLLFLSNLLNYLDRQLFTALFPVLAPAYHLSDTEIGFLGSSFTLSYLLAAPVVGVLLDRIAPRILLSGGVFIFSLGMAIASNASGTSALYSGRILTGVGEAVLIVVGPRLLGGGTWKWHAAGPFFSGVAVGGGLGLPAGLPDPLRFSPDPLFPRFPGVASGRHVSPSAGPEVRTEGRGCVSPSLLSFTLLLSSSGWPAADARLSPERDLFCHGRDGGLAVRLSDTGAPPVNRGGRTDRRNLTVCRGDLRDPPFRLFM